MQHVCSRILEERYDSVQPIGIENVLLDLYFQKLGSCRSCCLHQTSFLLLLFSIYMLHLGRYCQVSTLDLTGERCYHLHTDWKVTPPVLLSEYTHKKTSKSLSIQSKAFNTTINSMKSTITSAAIINAKLRNFIKNSYAISLFRHYNVWFAEWGQA